MDHLIDFFSVRIGLEVTVGADGKAQSTYLRDAYRFRIGGQ
jgi:hypothetical protein